MHLCDREANSCNSYRRVVDEIRSIVRPLQESRCRQVRLCRLAAIEHNHLQDGGRVCNACQSPLLIIDSIHESLASDVDHKFSHARRSRCVSPGFVDLSPSALVDVVRCLRPAQSAFTLLNVPASQDRSRLSCRRNSSRDGEMMLWTLNNNGEEGLKLKLRLGSESHQRMICATHQPQGQGSEPYFNRVRLKLGLATWCGVRKYFWCSSRIATLCVHYLLLGPSGRI